MIAQIVPLRRFPKGIDFFSYQVPTELESTIIAGQLVQIPFRNSQTLGIVFSLEHQKETTYQKKMKPLTKILFEEPLVLESFLFFLKKIGAMYGVALSTLFEHALPELTLKTVSQLIVPPLTLKKNKNIFPEYKKYSTPDEHKKILLESLQGQTLILVPEKQYLHTVLALLPPTLQKQTVVWHGDLKPKEKRKIWCDIRNKEKNIILSTRSGVFLPLFELDTLIVDYEHHREHKSADQAPRFQVKDVTRFIGEYSGAREIHMSYSPSIESYYSLYKNGYSNADPEATLHFARSAHEQLPLIVDMKDERKGGNYSPLGEKVEQALLATKADVFLFINRKGAGTVMICKDCRHEEKCPQCELPFVYHAEKKILQCHYCKIQKPIPLACIKCGSVLLEFKGVGTENIEKRVKELIQQSEKTVIRIESEEIPTELQETSKPKIIIGTEQAFEYVDWKKTEVVAMLDLDRQISLPEFKASEYAWDLVQEIQYCRNQASTFFIQTWDPKQLLIKSLSEPDRLYRTNLNARQGIGYPPYRFLVRYFYGAPTAKAAQLEAQDMATKLEEFLTKEQKKGTITGPLEMQPKYFRGRFWYGIIVKLEKKNWYQDLCDLNRILPPDWKIDPNPNTLLHP